MIGLDTNILVRYLTRDDEQQWQQAATVIQLFRIT
jgi:predicted nucleic-acid-binding protein